MKQCLLLVLVFLAGNISTIANNPDPRMDSFDQYIKPESEIVNTHPFLLFGADDIPVLRKKMNDPYFKTYTSDLLYFADICIKKYSDDNHFPFTENPNYQTISEVLVMAYLLTGQEKYSHKAIELTKTFVNDHYLQVPVRDSGKFINHLNNGNSISFILNTIAIVYDSLYQEMTDDERFLIRKGLAYFCKITYEMAITEEYGLGFNKNYRAGGMGALGLACLAIKNDTNLEVQEWLDKAMRISIAWCNVAIKPDGIYPEGVTYLYYMLRNQLLFFEALKRNNNMDFFKRTNLKQSIIWTLWSSLPWQYEFDNFSDGAYNVYMHDMPFILQNNYPGYGDYLIHKVYGDSLRYRSNPWAMLFGKKPTNKFNPIDTMGLSKLFPYGGMAAFRTGWSEKDLLLLTYATDYEYAAHSQADRGQFNIYGYGKKWAIDSGYGNDGKIENSATPAVAHNIVLIDGKGEAFDPSMRQSGTFADIVDFKSNNHMGYSKINQKDAYDWYARYSYQNKKDYNPVIKAFRHTLFINKGKTPPYIIIYDDIQKDEQSHRYTWQFHTDPANLVSILNNSALITPTLYSGKAIYANGSGGWDSFTSPGFNIFRDKPGNVSFNINVPQTTEYILWAFGCGSPYTWGETEVWANGENYGRFHIGQTKDFAWVKFSVNKKRLHTPQLIRLNSGKNTISLKGVSSGYKAAKFILTTNTEFIPQGINPTINNEVTFGVDNITNLEDAVIIDTKDTNSAKCLITMLNPQDIQIKTDFYQPTKDPLHPRILFKTDAVNPNFLTMVYPYEAGMEQPVITSDKNNGYTNKTISWNKYTDHIILNTDGKTINTDNIKTDAKLLFYRLNNKSRLVRLLVTDGSTLQIDDEKVITLAKNKALIIER